MMYVHISAPNLDTLVGYLVSLRFINAHSTCTVLSRCSYDSDESNRAGKSLSTILMGNMLANGRVVYWKSSYLTVIEPQVVSHCFHS